jgi:hypothetical protein
MNLKKVIKLLREATAIMMDKVVCECNIIGDSIEVSHNRRGLTWRVRFRENCDPVMKNASTIILTDKSGEEHCITLLQPRTEE